MTSRRSLPNTGIYLNTSKGAESRRRSSGDWKYNMTTKKKNPLDPWYVMNKKRNSLTLPLRSSDFGRQNRFNVAETKTRNGVGADSPALRPTTTPLLQKRSLRSITRKITLLRAFTRRTRRIPKPSMPIEPMREISLIDRFRRAANIVYVCAVLSKRGNRRTQRETRDPLRNLQTTEDNFGGLAFDPSYFKANRQQRLSEDCKRMLTTKSTLRTDYDIKYIQIALRNIQSFAEYPVRMQQKLCKVGWLEMYEPNRCIIRQGHIAHAFYIILSGTVMVTVNDGEHSRVVCFLKRGDSFGELAILHKEKRASTVISRDSVELLAISTSDFEDIFMGQGGVKNVNDPDHQEFLESLYFLNNWPIEVLHKYPKECVFNFFGRGDVLVKDSNYSDWIYIVKSGSCCVLKKLKKVKPRLKKRLSFGEKDGVLNILETINSHRQHAKLMPLSDRATNVDNSSLDSLGNATDTSPSETTGRDSSNSIHTNSSNVGTTARKRRLTPATKGVYLSTTTMQEKKERKKSGGRMSVVTKKEEEVIPEGFVQQKRTLATDLDNAKRPEERTEADKHPVFVVLHTLEKGGIFGLAPLVFFDQPSLSLVSNGAECIMIRKKFYMEHTTEDIRRRLRRQVQPYPSDEELQNSLQDYMNWAEYKDQTLSSTVNTVGANRLQRQLLQK
ncbi:cyclic nucleotide-binding domain-containing protein 2-like isoform X2 [Ptychodera flava]|uniref:cyclic nucleotide-binding domain-containing protein 2-like isoform X2 n=1 Tax=Ptychodera flava TaxID=63121 RepID=UPI00396A2AD7